MLNFFRRYIFHDLGLKLFSLLMAILLWATVTRDFVTEVALNVPVEFHGMPENLQISSDSVPPAQVRLRGPARQVQGLRQWDIHLIIELAGLHPGSRTFQLGAGNVHLPRGLTVAQVVPAEMSLDFDWRKTRTVQVRPRVVGTFSRDTGMHISNVLADPPEITIAGPQKRVEAVDAATTDPVDATGISGRQTFTTHAYVSDPLVQVLRPEPVRVTLIVGK
jgi:diadenylate cyclase